MKKYNRERLAEIIGYCFTGAIIMPCLAKITFAVLMGEANW